MARSKYKLGEILVKNKLLSINALKDAIKYAKEHNRRLGEALIELELCSEKDVTKALAKQFDMRYINLDKTSEVTANLKLIPTKMIKDLKVLPLGEEDGRLKVVISDPLDLEKLDLLRFKLNPNIECALAPASKIQKFIQPILF